MRALQLRAASSVGSAVVRSASLDRRFLLPLGAGLAALALFHLLVLAERIADASILQPAVALRWGGAGMVLLALDRWRRGPHHLNSRRALALGLLVLLLHVPALDSWGTLWDPIRGAAPTGSQAVPILLILMSGWSWVGWFLLGQRLSALPRPGRLLFFLAGSKPQTPLLHALSRPCAPRAPPLL